MCASCSPRTATLEAWVEKGQFREDLYHRINVLALKMPPLRERLDDIEPLAHHFLSMVPYPDGGPWQLTPETLATLRAYPWPGNVREFRNVIRRACILAQRPVITPDLLPFSVGSPRKNRAPASDTLRPLWMVERDHIRAVLDAVGGNKSRAADVLGVDRKTLYAKIAKYDL